MGDKITPIQDEKESFIKIEETSNTSIALLGQQENKETNFPGIIDISSLEEEKEQSLKIEEEKKEGLGWMNILTDYGKQAALSVMELTKYPPHTLLLSRNNKDLLKITSCKFDNMHTYQGFFVMCKLDENVQELIKEVWKERKSLKCNYALDTVWGSWKMIIPITCGVVTVIGGLKLWGPRYFWTYYSGIIVLFFVFFLMGFVYCQDKRRHRIYREYYK